MSDRPAEVAALHTRLMKCALEVEPARAYWQRRDPAAEPPAAAEAFADYWFGARSMARVEVLLANFRLRFDAYPQALDVLHRWSSMSPDVRVLVGHWHLQLADPLYRAFTAECLIARHAATRPTVTRDHVADWVTRVGPARWTAATCVQFASKLLSSAYAAGLVAANRDPRPVVFPTVPDDALAYLLYLLRGVDHTGTLTDNPYLVSVGLVGRALDDRLRRLPGVAFARMGALTDLTFEHADLRAWAEATLPLDPRPSAEVAR